MLVSILKNILKSSSCSISYVIRITVPLTSLKSIECMQSAKNSPLMDAIGYTDLINCVLDCILQRVFLLPFEFCRLQWFAKLKRKKESRNQNEIQRWKTQESGENTGNWKINLKEIFANLWTAESWRNWRQQ